MKSRRTPGFRDAFERLPSEVRESARRAYRLFRDDPGHRGLRFKRVHASRPIWAVRIGLGYRALGIRSGDVITWF